VPETDDQRAALKARILAFPRWYHSFQLDEATKIVGWAEESGAYPPTAFAEHAFTYYQLPERWDGKSVLDVGGWDGALSLELERRGSSRVLLVNPEKLEDLDLPLKGEGTLDHFRRIYAEKGYPLREIHSSGARLMFRWFGSRAEIAHSSVYDLGERLDEPYDLVLCLGLLYHLRDPVRGLLTVARLTRERMILETMCFPQEHPLANAPEPYCEFLGGDGGQNWWRFSYSAIERMLVSCGFERWERKSTWRGRCVYHAFK
jgi:tRNA (mo5U34)-methyltransferase